MDTSAPNFLIWHYTQSLPQVVTRLLNQLASTPRVFNITGLLAHLFSPYRRLEVGTKAQRFGVQNVADRLSFNLISRLIGASVRLILIIAWLLAAVLLSVLDLLAILIWIAFPPLSLGSYFSYINNTFFESDTKDAINFSAKIKKTTLYKNISLFFEDDFAKIIEEIEPSALNLAPNPKPKDVFLALVKNYPNLKTYLDQKSIKTNHFEILVNYLAAHLEKPPVKTATIGQTLTFGYTNILNRYATELLSQQLPSPEKHQTILEIEKILTRPKNNNVILVGDPGVGRHNTLQELSAAVSRDQLPTLANHRIMLLDTTSLAATGKNLPEAKSSFENVLEEAKGAGNIILAIDHVDRIASPKDGRLDLTDVLTAVLTDNSLPIIGITNPDDYNRYLRPNANFSRLFERVDVEEATIEETVSILVGKALEAFRKNQVKTLFSALVEIAQKSNTLIQDRKQPEKSIILLEDAVAEAASDAAEAKSTKDKTITKALVDQIISIKSKTPIGLITKTEVQKLKDLETILHQRIVGQNEAITELARALRRARAEIETTNRPIGSFLFLGPTGVGKTETAKALAQTYFGSEERMLRLDMSEFQDQEGPKRLIGDPNTQTPGRLASMVRENPFSLLLLDEFEKANPAILNLFLQILDEGFLTDAFGKRVSFTSVIIIATSNAGAEFIRELIAGSDPSRGPTPNLTKNLIDYVLENGIFSPELINRFDGVVVYLPLTPEEVVKITELMLKQLGTKLKESKNISMEITPELAQKVAVAGFDMQFGARPIRRLIQDKIEDEIAKMILDGSVKNGDKIPAATLISFLP